MGVVEECFARVEVTSSGLGESPAGRGETEKRRNTVSCKYQHTKNNISGLSMENDMN